MKIRSLSRLLAVMLFSFVLVSVAGATPINTIWIGGEDIALPGGDKDYNDVVFRLTGSGLSIVQVNGNGAWQQMVTPNQDETPFWDNLSWDGSGRNIGYFMTGTGGFTGNAASPNIPVSQLEYWGVGTSADPSFLLFGTGTISGLVNLEVSAWAASNQAYWFNPSTPADTHLLIPDSATAGYTFSFDPGGNFGIKLVSPSISATTNCSGYQFAEFQQIPSGVPEPATYGMLGTALIALGAFHRRRQLKS